MGVAAVASLHPFALTPILRSRLGAALGGHVHGIVRLRLDGAVEITGFSLTPAGCAPVCSGARVVVPGALYSFVFGSAPPEVRVVGGLLALEHDLDSKAWNIERLVPVSSGSSQAFLTDVRLQGVSMTIATLQSGRRSGWLRTKIDVALSAPGASGSQPGVFGVDVRELGAAGRPPFSLAGTCSVAERRMDLTGENLDLGALVDGAADAAGAAWRLRGLVSTARVLFDPVLGLRFKGRLDGAAFDAPLPESLGAKASVCRVEGVSGGVTLDRTGLVVDASGTVQGEPAAVVLRSGADDIDAPWRCELRFGPLRVGVGQPFMRLAPERIAAALASSAQAHATVEARVTVSSDGGAAPNLRTEGRVRFSDGTAVFKAFAYPLSGVQGEIRFDNEVVELVSGHAHGPTGGRLRATGRAPLSDPHGWSLAFAITDLPLDSVLLDRLQSDSEEFIGAFFDAPSAHVLRGLGLYAGAGGDGLGGIASATATLGGSSLSASGYTQRIEATFDELRLFPKAFPYPLTAYGVRALITDDKAVLETQDLRGATGARAACRALIDLKDAAGSSVFRPDIELDVASIPVDASFVAALERVGGIDFESPAPPVDLACFGFGGELKGSLRISTVTDGLSSLTGRVGVVGITGVPLPDGSPAVSLAGGEILFDGRRVQVEGVHGNALGSPARLVAEGTLPGGPAGGAMVASFAVDGLSLEAPLEFVAPSGSSGAIELLRSVRASGAVDAVLAVTVASGGSSESSLSVVGGRDIAFDTRSGRVTIPRAEGSMTLDPAGAVAEFNAFRTSGASAVYSGGASALFEVNGRWGFGVSPSLEDLVRVSLYDARVRGSGIRALLCRRSQLGFFESVESVSCDGEIEIARGREGSPEAFGWLSPLGATFVGKDGPVEVRSRGGRLRFSPDMSVLFEGLLLSCGHLTAAIDGVWEAPARRLALLFDARCAAVGLVGDAPDAWPAVLRDEPAMGLASPDVCEAFRSLALGFEDGVSLHDGRLSWHADGAAEGPGGWFESRVAFQGGAMLPGLQVRGADGQAHVRAAWGEGSGPEPSLVVDAALDRCTLLGAAFDGSGVVYRLWDSGESRTGVVASCAAGRITSDIETLRTERGQLVRRVRGRASGVGLGPLLAGLGRRSVGVVDRGALRGWWAYDETVGAESATRYGVASLTADGGPVFKPAFMGQLLELSHLQAPASNAFNRLSASLRIEGSVVHIDDAAVRSSAIELRGAGHVDLSTETVTARFSTEGRRGQNPVQGFIDSIRGELVQVSVDGSLSSPAYGLTVLQSAGTLRRQDKRGTEPPEPVYDTPRQQLRYE